MNFISGLETKNQALCSAVKMANGLISNELAQEIISLLKIIADLKKSELDLQSEHRLFETYRRWFIKLDDRNLLPPDLPRCPNFCV